LSGSGCFRRKSPETVRLAGPEQGSKYVAVKGLNQWIQWYPQAQRDPAAANQTYGHGIHRVDVDVVVVVVVWSRLFHVVLSVILKVLLDVGGGLLVLLVLGHQVVHVGLGLGELHLVHALPGVPVEEGLAPEHGGELL